MARVRVAIAEDEEDERRALELALSDAGFEVIAFEDGFELMDYFDLGGSRVRWPDAVIADVQMPGRTGVEALEAARARGLRAPILVVTGQPTKEVERRVHALGGALLIPKPIDVEEISRVIQALVRSPQDQEAEAKGQG